MTLKVEGDPGYGSASAGGRYLFLDGSETVPLLIPEPEPQQNIWKPLSKEELERFAGGPGWRKFRSRLVLAFWISWVVMLGSAIAVIVQSPRNVTPLLLWWQKDPFCRLRPALLVDSGSGQTNCFSKMSERLPYLRSMGVGAVILEGLFRNDGSPPNLTQIDRDLGSPSQFRHFITESRKAGVKVILDLCELDLSEPKLSNATNVQASGSGYIQYSLRYWLEQGVSGFRICDTDTVFSVKTLMEWSQLMKDLSSKDDERILMIRQMGDNLPALNTSSLVNGQLVEIVTKPLIPPSHQPLSAPEVTEAIEANLQMPQGPWPSWTLGGEVPWELQRAILVLMMTLPGTPIIKYGDEMNLTQHLDELGRPPALFRSLSKSRASEEALIFGSFTFLPFNTTMSSSTLNSTTMPPLAFLRSWACVQFLVLLNFGSEAHILDPEWTNTLPKGGVFVTSTGLDRLGPVSLGSIKLKPHEAIVIKLFKTDNLS